MIKVGGVFKGWFPTCDGNNQQEPTIMVNQWWFIRFQGFIAGNSQ